jgi:RNA polymerase sigma-70 factor (ECF subfamily)
MYATTEITDITYLVKLAQEGNIEAFEMLFDYFEHDIFVYLVCHLHNREDADDVSQLVFLKVWRNIGMLKDATCFKPWLHSITRRQVCDYWRGNKLINQSCESLILVDETLEIAGPEESAVNAELFELTLRRLPSKLRKCLQLHDVCGCSAAEIAQKVHICEASVCTYISAARKQFRQIYRQLRDEYSEYTLEE